MQNFTSAKCRKLVSKRKPKYDFTMKKVLFTNVSPKLLIRAVSSVLYTARKRYKGT
jgi:hypothetical protein